MLEIDKVYNQDCIEGMRKIDSGSVDLIVTDPPYLIDYSSSWRRNKAHKFCHTIANDDNPDLVNNYIRECYRILKDDAAMYMFCSGKTLDKFMNMARDAGFKIKNTIIWVKDNWTAGDLEAQYGQQYEPCLLLNKGRAIINGKRLSDVWNFKRVSSNSLVHQNQKPLPLIMQCIEKHSHEGGVIFDGFMGSGTTAVACMMLKRHYIGFELDKEYYNVCQKRIHQTASEPMLF